MFVYLYLDLFVCTQYVKVHMIAHVRGGHSFGLVGHNGF